jgi:hypothetical protein
MSMVNVAMVAEVSAVLGGDTRKASYFLTMTDWASAAGAITAAFEGALPPMPANYDPSARRGTPEPELVAAAVPVTHECEDLEEAEISEPASSALNTYRLLKICGQRQPLRAEQLTIAMLSKSAAADVCSVNELLTADDALEVIDALATVLLHASRTKQLGRALEGVARLVAAITTLATRRLRERCADATDAMISFALRQSGYSVSAALLVALKLVEEQRALLEAHSACEPRLVGIVFRHLDYNAGAAARALERDSVCGVSLSRFLRLADGGCLLSGRRLGTKRDALVAVTNEIAKVGTAVDETSTEALGKDVLRLAKTLAGNLANSRAYAALDGETAESSAVSPPPAAFGYDPRFLIFESVTGFLLRSAQIATIHKFIAARAAGEATSFCVQQMIMGAGKTSVVGPICCMMLADMESLVVSICPGALLIQTRMELEKIFSAVLQKRVVSLVFRRADPRMRDATHIGFLHDKLQRARYEGSVVVATPDVPKSMVLQFIDLILGVKERAAAKPLLLTPHALVPSKAARAALAPAAERIKAQARAADALGRVLKLFGAAERGIALLDEVDLVLHPLRSELNYPVGEGKVPLPPTRLQPPHGQRWGVAMHILDPLFWSVFERHTLPEARPEGARDAVETKLAAAVARGIEETKLQASPHAVLLDPAFYECTLKPLWAEWALLWVLDQPPLDTRAPASAVALRRTMLRYLGGEPEGSPLNKDEKESLSLLNGEAFELLNLAKSWVDSLLPHCFAKINRVKFGLLRGSDIKRFGGVANVNEARRLLAVPFVGKDAPSATSEFAHPDATIGLSILAYRYDGLRHSDCVLILRHLKDALAFEFGEIELRKHWQQWEEWKAMARSDLNKRLLAAEARTARASTLRGESEAGKTKKKQQLTFTERLEAAVDELGESVDPLSVPTLDLIEAANEDDVSDVWRAMRHLPELVHTYLAVLVFPRCTPHRPAKLSASGVDLGGGTLFGSCFGFSGTPSAMLPAKLKPKRVVDMMERGSNAKMIRTLTDRNLTKVELLSTCVAAGEKWSVDDVMKWVAHHSTPRFNALIDTGALITGLNNEEVARRLLAVGGPGTGLSGIEVCVFFDDDGGQWFVDRSGSAAMPLSRCGIALEQRFVFYDQCHCTGTCVTLFSIYCMTEYYANIMILYNDYCHAGTLKRCWIAAWTWRK